MLQEQDAADEPGGVAAQKVQQSREELQQEREQEAAALQETLSRCRDCLYLHRARTEWLYPASSQLLPH